MSLRKLLIEQSSDFMFHVYRSISLNDEELLNKNDIGCSWSLSEEYPIQHAEINIMRARNKDGYILIETEVNLKDVDLDETKFAYDNRIEEDEIILNNIDIMCNVIYSSVSHIKEGYSFNGSVGNCSNFEDYLGGEYEGDTTTKEIIQTIKKYK